MALTSILVLPGNGFQANKPDSVADFLLRDDIERAEALLQQQGTTAESLAFRGEIAYRRGNFAQAESFYLESAQLHAGTARAHFGLGKLALTKLKSKEAIVFFKRAIEIAPSEPLPHLYAGEAYGIEKDYVIQASELREFLKLSPDDPERQAEAKCALEMLDALGGEGIGITEAPDAPRPLPFQTTLNLLFASVMLNGRGPFRFAIDTGATQLVLAENLATSLGLQPITTTVMHGVGGGGRVESQLFKLNELTLGDLKLKNLPVGTFNDPLVCQIADGILGTAVLSDFMVTVNYSENRLEFSNRKHRSDSIEVLTARYFSNLLLIPIELNDGLLGNFIVDTGAVTTVLSRAMAAKLGVTQNTPDAEVDMGLAGVGGLEGVVLRVPDVTLKTKKHKTTFPHLVAIDFRNISRMIGTEISGIVGNDFLSRFSLTLDYTAAEVHLSPCSGGL